MNLPEYTVPGAPAGWAGVDPADWPWHTLPSLPPFRLASGAGPAAQQTRARLCYDEAALHIQFECDDADIWGTLTRHDDPIYDEEVAEVFISPGPATPTRYYEIEISPNNVLFDGRIHNPTGLRADLELDLGWDPPIAHRAWRDDANNRWGALLALPWADLAPGRHPPAVWRANFFRIERPRGADPEFSCWSPTFTDPADFHRPAFFGTLVLAGVTQ